MARHAGLRWSTGIALILLAIAAAGCAPHVEPEGIWVRRDELFFCDWEGGPNQGKLQFDNDGRYSEHLEFQGANHKYSTSASGHWSVLGETMTLELNRLSGKGEDAPIAERMRLLFTASQGNSALMLTLTTIVHEDDDQARHVIDVPKGERCTAVYERPRDPHPFRKALAALGVHS